MEDHEGWLSDPEDFTVADWTSELEDTLSNLRISDQLGYTGPCYSMESMATASFDFDDLLDEQN
jgi:hypothetical protein